MVLTKNKKNKENDNKKMLSNFTRLQKEKKAGPLEPCWILLQAHSLSKPIFWIDFWKQNRAHFFFLKKKSL